MDLRIQIGSTCSFGHSFIPLPAVWHTWKRVIQKTTQIPRGERGCLVTWGTAAGEYWLPAWGEALNGVPQCPDLPESFIKNVREAGADWTDSLRWTDLFREHEWNNSGKLRGKEEANLLVWEELVARIAISPFKIRLSFSPRKGKDEFRVVK